MDLGLHGKAVLVTGGNRGIGRQIALDFAGEGANFAICARNRALLDKTAADIHAVGVEELALAAGLFEATDCRRVVDATAEAFGRLDILVNNASTIVSGTLQTATDDQLMERLLGRLWPRCGVPGLRSLI